MIKKKKFNRKGRKLQAERGNKNREIGVEEAQLVHIRHATSSEKGIRGEEKGESYGIVN